MQQGRRLSSTTLLSYYCHMFTTLGALPSLQQCTLQAHMCTLLCVAYAGSTPCGDRIRPDVL